MEKKHIYLLSYALREPNGCWRGALIGVYSSLEQAERAIARLRERPGFRDHPEGFYINGRLLDEDYDDPTFFLRQVGPDDWPGPGRLDVPPGPPPKRPS